MPPPPADPIHGRLQGLAAAAGQTAGLISPQELAVADLTTPEDLGEASACSVDSARGRTGRLGRRGVDPVGTRADEDVAQAGFLAPGPHRFKRLRAVVLRRIHVKRVQDFPLPNLLSMTSGVGRGGGGPAAPPR